MKHFLITILLLITFQIGYGQTLESQKRFENDSVYIDFINPFYAPIEMKLSALDSTKAYIRVRQNAILNYQDTLHGAFVVPKSMVKDTSNINSSHYINFKGNFGDPKSIADTEYRYTLPYPKNKRYKIIQSFGGKFSHNKPHSKYAIDFGTKVGDTITASRDGIVFFVKEDSDEHCRTRKCIDKGNKVYILHKDGTMAHYVHLKLNGALVEVGDKVDVGEPIAISGMTGFTTIPHLHLVVYKANGISIPFYFKGQKSKKLKQGKYYTRRK
ncbi:M23 family metallopeptidase [Winogradskyella vincentii]|uniref:M23 family metallopeptidase n=1 Tax=Winogradskyella vincentii TaxID=2877122 RepID=A0ABS7Y2J9_9FLAO|nr:M23 family metallopeptidase [Winogradskyella vincentii]MCA0153560.1 M23 family metallopeptidase [Winogradskyella vincentii]